MGHMGHGWFILSQLVINWLVFNGTVSTKMLYYAMRKVKVC